MPSSRLLWACSLIRPRSASCRAQVHLCLYVETPERPAAFYLLLFASLIPLLDTAALALSSAADWLAEKCPCFKPCKACIGGLAQRVLDAVYGLLAAPVLPLSNLVEGTFPRLGPPPLLCRSSATALLLL